MSLGIFYHHMYLNRYMVPESIPSLPNLSSFKGRKTGDWIDHFNQRGTSTRPKAVGGASPAAEFLLLGDKPLTNGIGSMICGYAAQIGDR